MYICTIKNGGNNNSAYFNMDITNGIQLGNYLRVPSKKKLIKVAGVMLQTIAYVTEDGKIEWVECRDVLFVPITPTILIDNGFKEKYIEDELDRRFVYKDNQCTITIDFCYMRGDDGMNFINRLVDIDGATFNFNAYVNDVHILQNVLRQLDIDKEIVVKR